MFKIGEVVDIPKYKIKDATIIASNDECEWNVDELDKVKIGEKFKEYKVVYFQDERMQKRTFFEKHLIKKPTRR